MPQTHAAVARAICGTPWAFGEHAGAESPLDASFWPMHPTLDRLLQCVRSASTSDGGSCLESRLSRRYKRLAADFEASDWAAGSLCKYAATAPCLGHREHDLTAFKTAALDAADGFRARYLTNREVVNATDPRRYAMTYVYADFAWPHCGAGLFKSVG